MEKKHPYSKLTDDCKSKILEKRDNTYTPGEMMADIRSSVASIRTKNAPYIYIAEVKMFDNVIDEKTGRNNAARIVETWNNYDQLKADNEALKADNVKWYGAYQECLKSLEELTKFITKTSDNYPAELVNAKMLIKKHTQTESK